jgi:hypothetical protein
MVYLIGTREGGYGGKVGWPQKLSPRDPEGSGSEVGGLRVRTYNEGQIPVNLRRMA